jgi:hypothetical protein
MTPLCSRDIILRTVLIIAVLMGIYNLAVDLKIKIWYYAIY